MSAAQRVFRSLRRSPGFVAIATISMGVALGISTSVFAVMDAMTHPDPPFRDVSQLQDVGYGIFIASPPPASLLNTEVTRLEGVERVVGWTWGRDGMVMLGGRFAPVSVGQVSRGYFDLLGTYARLGRLFTSADHDLGDVAVVTDKIWRRDFANRDVIGDATTQYEGRVYRIVGVLPTGTERSLIPGVFIAAADRPQGWSNLLVRLKSGERAEDFQTRIKALNDRLIAAYAGPKDRGIRAYIRGLQPDPLMVRDFHRAMVGAAICILLIACANVAALMLARGLVKKRDYALRLALGAQPAEIGREVVVEVAILAVAGCLTGAVITSWFVGVIGRAMPVEMEWEGFVQPQWSWRVLTLSMAAVVGSIAVAGGFPAWNAARTDPAGPLKEGAGGTTGRAHTRFRWLVIGELAMAMTLLMSTSLMLKSIRKMGAYDFGYANERLLVAGVAAPWRQDSTSLEDAAARRQQGLEAIRQVDGVEAVVLGIRQSCGIEKRTIISDRTAEGGPSLNIDANTFRSGGCTTVGPRFFSTLQLPMADGRDFEEGDLAGNGAAILDEKTAKRLFPAERAVGRAIKMGDWRSEAKWYTIVGVVKNHMLNMDPNPELGADSGATLYTVAGELRTWYQRSNPARGSKSLQYFIRSSDDLDGTALRVMRALAPLTPERGNAAVVRWDQDYQSKMKAEKFLSLIFTLLGLASLLLGAAGLYSVIAYVSGQRMREFAVRIALGATKENVAKLVLRDGFLMAVGGTGIGAGFGMWAAFLLWDRMWGIYPVDVEALVVAEVTLVIVTMLACLGPARRASKSDPLEIIRSA